MFESIDTVVFDLGGVLIDLYRDRCVEAFRRIGFPQGERTDHDRRGVRIHPAQIRKADPR